MTPDVTAEPARHNALFSPEHDGGDALVTAAADSTAAGANDSRLLAGQIIGGKYRVSHLLGEGGMASVWAGSNERTGKLVALKVIRRSFMATPGAEIFLQGEGLAASRVNHPNVVSVFDVIEHEGMACIVMELLDGVSLGTYIAGHTPLSLLDTVGILLPAMRGVAAAHAQGVIHRDLKPHNIFLCVDADGRVVTTKVLDFGISIMMDWARGQSVAAMPGLVGTPSYMAPEHIEGRPELDPRTDVYGFGLLLYEALSGAPAFPAVPQLDELLRRVLTEFPIPLRERRSDLPMGIVGIVETAMAKQPEQRFQSLNQMMAAIEGQMVQPPLSAALSAPTAVMSYTVSGPLSIAVPSLVGREPSEPYATQNYGTVKRESGKSVPPAKMADVPSQEWLAAGKTPAPGTASSGMGHGPAPSTAHPAPTVLLARAILARTVRDWSNHHYLRALRERKFLRILVPVSAALLTIALIVLVRGPGGPGPVAPLSAKPLSPAAPPAVVPVPRHAKPEVTPLPTAPASPPSDSEMLATPVARRSKGHPGAMKGQASKATGERRAVSAGFRKGKAETGPDKPITPRTGFLKVDDF